MMPVLPDAVAHLYRALGLPPGAPIERVRAAQLEIESACRTALSQGGVEGATAASTLEATTYARDQIETLHATGKLSSIPDVAEVERARAGCLVPLTLVIGLLVFLRISSSAPTIQATATQIAASPPSVTALPEPTAPTSQSAPTVDEVPPTPQPVTTPTDPLPASPQLPADVLGQVPVDTQPVQDNNPPAQVPTPDPADPLPQSTEPVLPAETKRTQTVQTPIPSTEPVAAEGQAKPTQESMSSAGGNPEADQYTAASVGTFTLGSSMAEVRSVMGAPNEQTENTWSYGPDTVTFKNGYVHTYSNIGRSLKIEINPRVRSTKTKFTLGDSQDVVLSVMGTPTDQIGNTWSYGPDTVTFADGKVSTYSNIGRSLKIAIEPRLHSDKTTFTLGDSQDVVLSVMGTPTDQIGNTWSYGPDTVTFTDEKVSTYSNIGRSLKIAIKPRILATKIKFTIGDGEDVVLSVMGTPTDQIGNTWSYGPDTVTFENGRVSTYSNIGRSLKITIEPRVRSSKIAFSLGDSKDVVLSVMGTPTDQIGDTWSYGPDTVTFENGRVSTYSNIAATLKIR